MDIIIKNGRIIDGTGNPWFHGEIGIEEGKIKGIGYFNESEGDLIIDAKGRIVSPGFIDIHSHADATNFLNPKQESSIRQGVTTHVGGNCGYGLAPINYEKKDITLRYLGEIMPDSENMEIRWTTFGDYLKIVENIGIASNLLLFVGHGTIRIAAMGLEARAPTNEELSIMKDYVEEAMESGALGLSSGLLYPPGIFAKKDELIELCKVVAKYKGIYASHIRSYGSGLMKSLKEAIKIGEIAGIPVIISHISVFGKPFWGSSERVLKLFNKARSKGIEVNTDLHPYDSVVTDLMMMLPPWAYEGGKEKTLERLRDPEICEKIRYDQVNGCKGWDEWFPINIIGWDNIIITMLESPKYRKYEGESMETIANLEKKDPFTVLNDLLVQENADANMIITHLRGEEDIQNFIKSPLAAFEEDAHPSAPYGILSKGKPHPRYYGTYPKFLGDYVREKKVIPLEEAIKKMTSLPAQIARIRDRGLLKENFCADIVIFDANTVIDKATYANPHQYPVGIEYVIVNGEIVIEKGNHTEKLAGKILRFRSN